MVYGGRMLLHSVELPIKIANEKGEAYAVDPHSDHHTRLVEQASGVHISKGKSDNLDFKDGTIDAVVAMWMLHYVDDLDQSLQEMARDVNPQDPQARIVMVHGAPDNEVVNLINEAYSHLSDGNKTPSHQGYLLHRATEIFSAANFSDIEFRHVEDTLNFPEKELSEQCSAAVEVLSEVWHDGDPNLPAMKKNFIPILERHFEESPHEIGIQALMLTAKPRKEAH